MPASLNDLDALFAELATLTGMSPSDWSDFVSCTPTQRAVMVENYRDMQWTKNPDTFAKVLSVLTVIGNVAGVVTGVASAASAVAALKDL